MRTSFTSLLVAASFLGVAVAQLTIITPVPPPGFCEPILLQWSGGTPPYIAVRPPVVDITDSSTVISFGGLTNNSITWFVTTPAGTTVEFDIRDSTGATQNTAPFAIAAGTPNNCPGSSSSASSPPTSGSKPVSTSTTTSKSTSVTVSTTSVTSTLPLTPVSSSTAPPSSTAPGSSSSAASLSSVAPSSSASAPANDGMITRAFPGLAAAAALGAAFLAAVL